MNPPNNPLQNNQDQENKNIVIRINTNLKSFDEKDPQGIIKQSLNNCLGLNFKKFNNSYSRNTQNSAPEKLYFLSHNLRTNFEKDKKGHFNLDDLISKYNAQKFQQISNNILNQEKDYYKEFIEINGNIGINNLNIINNISSELRKINANNPFNYMQENPDFDFNNNKMGIYLLLQQNGIYGKIFDNKKNKISTSYKRCNEHQRRKELKKKEKNIGINQKKVNSFINISSSSNIINKSGNLSKISSENSIFNIKNNQIKSYLVEEESYLFEKYFNSFIPYFNELIINKNINTNDKILKLREVLDININNFREGRKNFCEFLKRIITPLNNNDNANKLTTKNLISRVIKYLENDFERKNYISIRNQNYHKKEDFISNYTNTIVYTYFSNVTTYSKSQTIILWAKIFFYIRLGWKKECIDFINSIEGININESGLREIKDSLDETKKINIQNYNEFKRILNQEKKEENPFKHACMVYMTKIPDQLYNNILLEINDHLWFNLNLINPQDNYEHLIIKKKENEDKDNILEINTNSNQNNDGRVIELIKLKNLQMFFESISAQEVLNLNNKNTNFAYIILMAGLLKFKKALSFMIKNNMYIDAITFYFILQQLGLYNNFDEINENIIKIQPQKILGEKNELEEIYQIYPRVTDNIPALVLFLVYSDPNFIQPLSYLLVETESFGILNNYDKKMQLFQNYIDNNMNNKNSITNFNVCLQNLIDKNTLRKVCKNIFELLLKHEMKKNSNLNPLFNVFKDLKMLSELTGILINKSIELLNFKKPIISTGNNGQISINLRDIKNQKYFGYSLILNYFGSLINDVNQLFIEKQNEKEYLIKNNKNNGSYNEKLFFLEKEIEENNIPISLLKQLPIIENIYEFIFIGNFDGALKLYMENINIVKFGFECQEQDYLNEFSIFINEILKKMKYGLIDLYPDILYLFVWLLKIELIDFQKKGYNNIIINMKDKTKALEFLLDKLCEISKNDSDLMPYNSKFQMTKIEVNQIQQFYYQNNYII